MSDPKNLSVQNLIQKAANGAAQDTEKMQIQIEAINGLIKRAEKAIKNNDEYWEENPIK